MKRNETKWNNVEWSVKWNDPWEKNKTTPLSLCFYGSEIGLQAFLDRGNKLRAAKSMMHMLKTLGSWEFKRAQNSSLP